MASALDMFAETLAGFEMELVVLMAALVAHRVLFSSTRVRSKPKTLANEPLHTGSPPSAAAARSARPQMQALRAAIANSDLEAAMAHLDAVSAVWNAGTGAALEPLLQRLLRLALLRSRAPAALRELGRRGLLNVRLVEGLLADAVQNGIAAIAAEVVGLAKAEGLVPTCNMYCTLLKSLGAEGRLEEAKGVFEQCAEKGTYVLNAFLDVCATCNDMRAAERVLAQAQGDQTADVSTYNIIMKGYLRIGEMARARAVMESMRGKGLSPNVFTFNALIDATLENNREDAWALLHEMKVHGVQPNQVTCSTLLKSIEHSSRATDHDIERILAIMGSVSGGMDEMLISSVCDACIRADRADLLRAQLRKLGSLSDVKMTGAHTFGSVIRAYGFVGDLEGTWARWREMRECGIRPTSITASFMVEALVTNAGPEAGLALIREMWGDKDLRDLINAVIYNSVLKGFAHQKRFSGVWAVYQEMLSAQLQLSVVTYNTIFDVCATCRELERIPGLMADMSRQHIEPNVISYSTIMKAYVQGNKLHNALALLNEMKLTKGLQPDEIAYNTVLDGCARHGLFDSGLALLQDMEDAGVKPSCYTLSLLVKLANRSRRLNQAFELCDTVSRKHCIRPNIHVFNNLMQACTNHRDHERALKVLERAARERAYPDARTYSILLGGCLTSGDTARVADLLRAAHGLRSTVAAACGLDAAALQVRGGLPFEPLSDAFAELRGGKEALALDLLRELRGLPGNRVDLKALARLATEFVR
jgi:pentatricopeptide repeat protein